nr:alpha/beta fold hydrolase [Synechococcus sp. RSCCF101]
MDGTGDLIRPQLSGLTARVDVQAVSIPPDDCSSWDSLRAQMVDLLTAGNRFARRAPRILCGESFGACLALQVAASHPELIDALILINPASSAMGQPWIRWGADLVSSLPRAIYGLSAAALLPFLIAQHRVSPANQRALLQAMRSVQPRSAAWRLSLLADFSARQLPLERIEQPVLLLASGADRLLPSVAEAAALSQRFRRASTVQLPGSGHACLLERKIRLGALVNEHAVALA